MVGYRDRASEASSAKLLEGDGLTVTMGAEDETPVPWVNANLGAHGFYRVRYAPDLLDALVAHLGELTPLERYTLVDDAWASVLAGTVEAATFVATAERFVDERDLSVWERITGGLSILDRLVDGDARDALHGRVAALVGPVRAELGADADPGEEDRTRTLRGVLLQAAALLGDDVAAQERAADLLDQFLAHPPSVDPSLASPALVVCATFGDVALHERLVAAFHGAANPQDRQRLQLSLARFRSPEALQRTLDMTLSGDIRSQDAPYLLGETVTNRDNAALAWNFVASHWDDIEQRFPANSLLAPRGRHPLDTRPRPRREGHGVPRRAPDPPGRQAGAPAHRAHGRDGRPGGARVAPPHRVPHVLSTPRDRFPREIGRWSGRSRGGNAGGGGAACALGGRAATITGADGECGVHWGAR